VGGNSGGDLNITSNGKFSSANSLILTDTLGAGKAGDINIQTNSVALTDGTRVSASSNSSGRGGNLTIRALESVELSSTNDSRSFINTDARASGDAGDLLIETGQLIVRDGSGISAGALYGSKGKGGNLTVNASDSVEVSGTTSDGRPSLISAGTAGTKPAGDLTINTSRLAIRDGGTVFTSTAGEGAGGNLTVNASESVDLSGTSADGLPSALSTDTFGSAKAGDLTINTSRFIARDGAAASVSTFGSGQGGNLILNASESVNLSGTSAKGFASGLLAQGFAAGNAGDLSIYTGDLSVQNRAKVTVAAGSLADTSVLTTRSTVDLGDGVNISIPTNFQAIGDAGTLKVEANRIYLNNQGSLLASTDSGEGGNIELTARDLILMRRNSLISAEARGGTRNGGNITINTPFVVGVPKEDSDIVADANQGRGGNIYITVEGIYGLRFRPRRTGKSDITASSNVVGQEGTVQINASFDPTQGLTNLPLDLAEAPMEDSCQANRETGSRFVVTGRGGLPPNPDDSLSSDPELVGLVTPARRTQQRSNPPVSNHSTRSTPTPVVEAQSWQFDANGNVVLTAQAPNVTPQTPWLTPADCHKHSNAELQSK
jgi:large exoprotein involved in heme utilization and adhesion